MAASDEPIEYDSFGRSEESAIWKGALALLTLIFILCAYNCGREIYFYSQGECVQGDLYRDDNNTATAVYEGEIAQIGVSRSTNHVVDNKVDVYFINHDIYTAMPMTRPLVWIADFVIIALLYAFFIYKIYRIYKKNKDE